MFLSLLCAFILLSNIVDHASCGTKEDQEKERIEGIYKCLMNEMCNCDEGKKLNACWERLPLQGEERLRKKLNQCEMLDIDFENREEVTYDFMAKHICEVKDALETEMKHCHHGVNEVVKNYVIEINSEMGREEESAKMERTRNCLAPFIMKCNEHGNICL